VIHSVWCNRRYFMTMDRAFTDVVEELVNHFMTAGASLINVTQQIKCAHCGSSEDEDSVDKFVVLERW